MGTCDVIVIGGGPAGSTIATLLAAKGRSVTLIERETFPRFQIGESLLPYNNDLFQRLGILERLRSSGFVDKYGAEFLTGDGGRRHKFRFDRTLPERYSRSFQVRRAEFDQMLLDCAREAGAEVHEGTRVTAVDLADPSRVRVAITDAEGIARQLDAPMVVDASGYAAVVGNRVGGKRENERLRKIAVFAHYERVLPGGEGDEFGNIVIVLLRDGWFWMIPLGRDLTSVGLVIDRDEFVKSGLEREHLIDHAIRATPYVAERMAGAKLASPVYTRKDFSYSMRNMAGPNFVLVGDAAGFIDPIFSTGVMIAMKSAELAADGIEDRLSGGTMSGLQAYERRMRKALGRYERMISRFYRREFLEVFLNPQARLGLVPVVIALLAGNVFESSFVRWKLNLFYLLVAIQRWTRVIAPPIEWKRLPAATRAATPED